MSDERTRAEAALAEVVALKVDLHQARADLAAAIEERERLRGEVDAAWKAVRSPVRGLGVPLAEVIESHETDRGALRALHEDMTVQVRRLRAVLAAAEDLRQTGVSQPDSMQVAMRLFDAVNTALRARAELCETVAK